MSKQDLSKNINFGQVHKTKKNALQINKINYKKNSAKKNNIRMIFKKKKKRKNNIKQNPHSHHMTKEVGLFMAA